MGSSSARFLWSPATSRSPGGSIQEAQRQQGVLGSTVSHILDHLAMDSWSNKDCTGKHHGIICCCFFFLCFWVVLKEVIDSANQQQWLKPIIAGLACRTLVSKHNSCHRHQKSSGCLREMPKIGFIDCWYPTQNKRLVGHRTLTWGSSHPFLLLGRCMWFCLISHDLVVSGGARMCRPWKTKEAPSMLGDFFMVLLLWGHPHSLCSPSPELYT